MTQTCNISESFVTTHAFSTGLLSFDIVTEIWQWLQQKRRREKVSWVHGWRFFHLSFLPHGLFAFEGEGKSLAFYQSYLKYFWCSGRQNCHLTFSDVILSSHKTENSWTTKMLLPFILIVLIQGAISTAPVIVTDFNRHQVLEYNSSKYSLWFILSFPTSTFLTLWLKFFSAMGRYLWTECLEVQPTCCIMEVFCGYWVDQGCTGRACYPSCCLCDNHVFAM